MILACQLYCIITAAAASSVIEVRRPGLQLARTSVALASAQFNQSAAHHHCRRWL